MKLSNLFGRGFFYFVQGYSRYVAMPTSFISFVSTAYYLMVNNISFLKNIFPSFFIFVVSAIIIGIPLSIFFGYFHYKGRGKFLFKAENEIQIESSVYATTKIQENMRPIYKWVLIDAKSQGCMEIVNDIEKLLRESGE